MTSTQQKRGNECVSPGVSPESTCAPNKKTPHASQLGTPVPACSMGITNLVLEKEYTSKAIELKFPDIDLPHSNEAWMKDFYQCIQVCMTSIATQIVKHFEDRIDDLTKSHNTIVSQAETSAKNARSRQNELLAKHNGMKGEYEVTKAMVTELRKENKELKDRVIKQESQSRRDNLLIAGFPEEIWETDADVRSKVHYILQLLGFHNSEEFIQIVRAHRKGPYIRGRERPIIVKFQSYEDRQNIFFARNGLRYSNYYINEDFPAEIEAVRRKMMPIVKAAQQMNKFKGKVNLHVDKLYVEGQMFTERTLHLLPPELNPKNLCERSSDDTHLFWREHSPLSNFYDCRLKYEETNYNDSETAFQHHKALMFKDLEKAEDILKCSHPLEAKRLGKSVRGFDQSVWEKSKDSLMQNILCAKFEQNPDLKQHLLATGTKLIAESSPHDRYFGTGVALWSRIAFNKHLWKGENKLGQILMNLRCKFISATQGDDAINMTTVAPTTE
jgi:ribA/ribD-fused uncharacterized protein